MDTRIDGSILSGKIVLLTGAGGGIGLEAAKAFAEMGAKVLIAEIGREKAVRKMCGDILARFGCPDIIFNNAAAVITGKIGEVSIEDWDLCYAVNLKAPVMLTSCFLEMMKERDSVNSRTSVPYNVLEKLQHYWEHQLKLLSGFEKDGQKFMEYSREIRGWIDDIRTLPWNTAGKFVDGLMISGLYLKQLIRGTEYGEENVADGKRQDSILDIRFESVWRG